MGVKLKILNFGSLNIDYVYQVNTIAKQGEIIVGRDMHIYCGGKGLHQSIALASAKANVYHAGVVGADGQILIDKLEANGVDTSLLKRVSGSSSHIIMQVDPNGNNSILCYADESLKIEEDYISDVLERFDEGDYLLVQNELENTDKIIRMAKENRMKVVLNPSPFTTKLPFYPLDCVDIFMMNEIEGCELTGQKNPEHILDVMHDKYPDAVVVLTLGENGAYCLLDDRVIVQKAYKATAVDVTAVGDTFTGYFLAEYFRNGIIEAALSLAAKASAMTVTVAGGADSIPKLEDVTRWI